MSCSQTTTYIFLFSSFSKVIVSHLSLKFNLSFFPIQTLIMIFVLMRKQRHLGENLHICLLRNLPDYMFLYLFFSFLLQWINYPCFQLKLKIFSFIKFTLTYLRPLYLQLFSFFCASSNFSFTFYWIIPINIPMLP